MDIKKELLVTGKKGEELKKESTVRTESIEDKYKKSVYLFLDKKYKESRKLLMMMPLQDVRQGLRDNIVFWIGMSFYKEKKYSKALNEFQKVIELYPKGNKVPEAIKLRKLCLKKIQMLNVPKD